jgi:two-component system cell cycle response regulator DivK
MNGLDTKNVLIVEDDLRNATLITAMLKIAGVTNTWMCHSGKEILNVVSQMPSVALVLLDLQLPGEDGYQIFERLCGHPVFQGTPIIAVTAQVMPDDVAKAEAVGFYGFLGKPLNFDRFPGQIRRLLEGERVWEPR